MSTSSRKRIIGAPELPSDPKALARKKIESFLGMTVEGMLLEPYVGETAEGSIIVYDPYIRESGVSDTKNRRLANAMYGLEGAVRALCQKNPPEECGESIAADRTIIDGKTGDVTKYKISASRAGADFGTFLSCVSDRPVIYDVHGGVDKFEQYVLLPRDRYLLEVLRFGYPHEPQFYASETDLIGPEWSSQEREMLENGGEAGRIIHPDRAYMLSDGKYDYSCQNTEDIYFHDRIFYKPLYRPDAPGLGRYVDITQILLRRLLDAVGGQHTLKTHR